MPIPGAYLVPSRARVVGDALAPPQPAERSVGGGSDRGGKSCPRSSPETPPHLGRRREARRRWIPLIAARVVGFAEIPPEAAEKVRVALRR